MTVRPVPRCVPPRVTTVFFGLGGDDILMEATVMTRCAAAAATDTLRGGNGNDILSGGSGNDTCDGGLGTDTADGCEVKIGIP